MHHRPRMAPHSMYNPFQNRETDRWVEDRQTDRYFNRQMGGWRYRQTDRQMDRQAYLLWMVGWGKRDRWEGNWLQNLKTDNKTDKLITISNSLDRKIRLMAKNTN